MNIDPPDVGAVIVSYNTRDLLASCLHSLESELERSGLRGEVWVVDNASTDGSAELAATEFPAAKVIDQAVNVGYAAAANVALGRWAADAETRPEWALVLNPDTELQPGALAAMTDALRAAPGAALAGPCLVYPDGRFQHSAFRYPGLAQTALDLFPVARLYDSALNGRYPRALYEGGRAFEVDFTLGACMLIRGDALATVGPMDEGFFMYCEEIDWCRRIQNAGHRVLCVPRAVVVHHAGASTRREPDAMFVQLWRSRLRLFRLHEPPWRRAVLAAAVRAGLAVRRMRDRLDVLGGRLSDEQANARARAYAAIAEPESP